MKKNYFILFIVMAFIGLNGFSQNQVVNGDFENWTAGAADNWLADGGAVAITQNTTMVENGASSCEVVWTSQDNQYLTSDAFAVTPGIEVNANFWVYDNDAAGRARLCIIWEGTDNYYGDYSEDMDSWQELAFTDLVPAGATSATFQIRFYDVSADWDGDATVIVDNVIFEANTTVNPEPTNYPTDFAAAASGTKVITTWVDATGDQLPLSYLVIGRNDGTPITAPVDGTPVADDSNWDDGQIAMNVVFGVQTYAVSVAANTDYTFAIYPFSNTGDAIDYKTDGTAPTASVTSSNTTVINEETFDADLGAWTGYSVIGDQVWEYATYGNPPGCAKMNGFVGAAVANEDWLISPALNLTNLETALFSFDHARNYGTNEALSVLVSTDYDGSSDPSTNGTWNDITSMFTFNEEGSWDFYAAGEGDVTEYKGANTYFAFKYTSSDSDAATWEIDNALIYGIMGVGIPENTMENVSVYPNPTIDFVNVNVDNQGSVKIYSINGQLFVDQSIETGVNTINISDLAHGTYLIQVSDVDGNSTTKKLLVK